MSRARKQKKELPENIAHLVAALDFVSPASAEDGSTVQTHCRVEGKMIVANNGLFAMGAPIDDEVVACPNTRRFLAALTKCDSSVAITILASGALSIKSGKFRATIPCADPTDVYPITPSPIIAPCDDRIKAALKLVAPFAKESADRVVLSSVLLRENTAVATNGSAMLEAWHGLSLPPMVISRKAVDRILAIDMPIVGFGWDGGRSATFHYEGGFWLHTRLYEEAWPNVDDILNEQSKPLPLPEGFFAAVDALEPWVKGDAGSGFYRFGEDLLMSEDTPGAGAVYELTSFGLQDRGVSLGYENMKLVRDYMTNVDFTTSPTRAFFFGQSARGVIMYARFKGNQP